MEFHVSSIQGRMKTRTRPSGHAYNQERPVFEALVRRTPRRRIVWKGAVGESVGSVRSCAR